VKLHSSLSFCQPPCSLIPIHSFLSSFSMTNLVQVTISFHLENHSGFPKVCLLLSWLLYGAVFLTVMRILLDSKSALATLCLTPLVAFHCIHNRSKCIFNDSDGLALSSPCPLSQPHLLPLSLIHHLFPVMLGFSHCHHPQSSFQMEVLQKTKNGTTV
jgi:hypothetical protein